MSLAPGKSREKSLMWRAASLFILVTAVCAAAARVLAHEVTYKGTVLSVEKDTVKVNVIDEKTKKASPMTFGVDQETKVIRGEVQVTFAEARIEKGESIAVTANLDDGGTVADVIRLPVRK
jgi:hypothetical protein